MITLKGAGIGAGLVTGAAGLTGLVGYSTGLFGSEPTNTITHTEITKLLKEENKYALLSTKQSQDAEAWTDAWTKYKQDNQERNDGQDKWSVNGWKKVDVPEVPAGFKSKCTEKKDTKVVNTKDPNYIDFTKYCARAKTMEEALKANGFTPLKDDNTDAKWKAKINTYKIANNQLPKAILSSGATDTDFATLKNGCVAALKLKTTDTDYEKTIGPVRSLCGA